jgi:hypothetical protein
MPLPSIPLIGTAVAIAGGALYAVRLRSQGDAPALEDKQTALQHSLVMARNSRTAIRSQLRALGARKLEAWHHNLGTFSRCQSSLKGVPDNLPELRFRVSEPAIELSSLSAPSLEEMIQCSAMLEKNRTEPSETDLLDLGARGLIPTQLTATGRETDCPTIRWLTPDQPCIVEAPLFGSLNISTDTQRALSGEDAIPDLLELQRLMAAMDDLQAITNPLLSMLMALDEAGQSLFSELRLLLLHINDNYSRMTDLPLPTQNRAPRKTVQHSFQLAAALRELITVPVLTPTGSISQDIRRTIHVGKYATSRFC